MKEIDCNQALGDASMMIRTPVIYMVPAHPSDSRRHAIPIEVARKLLSDPEALLSSLDTRLCLVEITIIDGERIVTVVPKTLIYPTSGNELYCSAERFPSYPDKLRPSARLLVEIVVVD